MIVLQFLVFATLCSFALPLSHFHLPANQLSVLSRQSAGILQPSVFPRIEANAIDTKHSPNVQYELNSPQKVYVFLSCLFVTCLLIGDVIGVKLFQIQLPFSVFGFNKVEHTCGMLTFPITFLLGDVINEYFGPKATKHTVYLGLVMSCFVFLVMNIAQALPYLDKPFNITKQSFEMIFGSAKLMYVASVAAYLVGSLSDIWLFGILKRLTGGRHLWLRATGSTVISQVIDSFIVSYLAFSLGKTMTGQDPASMREVLHIAVTGYGLKLFLAGVLTPFLYLMKFILNKRFDLQAIPVTSTTSEQQQSNQERLF